MPCMHPIPAARGADGRMVLSGVREVAELDEAYRGRADVVLRDSHYLLPCGSCVGCNLSRARDWTVRCMLELRSWSHASFLTLTFDDAHLPPTLSRSDVSRYFKRVWHHAKRDAVRPKYFACGEYGERFGRPHYHALVFGVPTDAGYLRDCWHGGFVDVKPVTSGRIAYTAGYVVKKVRAGDRRKVESVDYSTGEVYEFQPPFVQMSRRPGIASDARRFQSSWRKTALQRGREVPVPRYLHAAWAAVASDIEKEDLRVEREREAQRLTLEQLQNTELSASVKLSLKQEQRA